MDSCRTTGKLPVSSVATAFRKNSSVLTNAQIHRKALYSVRIDIESFFPSIKVNDLLRITREAQTLQTEQWTESDIGQLLAQACFDRDGRLPIGYPTSPDIANAVMYKIDTMLIDEISDRERYGVANLTRYADDFVFSTDKIGACASFLAHMQKMLATTFSPQLKINHKKTNFMSRKGGSTLITGLRITNQEAVTVHANYRDHVRLLLKLYQQGKLRTHEQNSLAGHLAYIEHVAPSLFTKLAFRYHSEIRSLRVPA